ncbi:helix-turn-helix domain-containing protein [bacterium]|nr:helix-turn-helix domain-containing protein [bacterium]
MGCKELGDFLRKEREKKGRSVEEMAITLKMTALNIQNLESGNIDAIRLNEIFVKSHLKSYISELGYNPEDTFKKFNIFEEAKREQTLKHYSSTFLFNPIFQILGVILFSFFIYYFVKIASGDSVPFFTQPETIQVESVKKTNSGTEQNKDWEKSQTNYEENY